MRRRWVYINGEAIEVGMDYVPVSVSPLVMPDIAPYKSMITGEEITSRSKHREHLREHNCHEVGNDSILRNPKQGIAPPNPEGRKELIRRQVEGMRHEEFKRMLKNDLDRIRWNSRGRPKTEGV